MVREVKEISKEEYDKIINMDPKQAYNYIADYYAIKSGYHPAGYGFYNPACFIKELKYFVEWFRNASCD